MLDDLAQWAADVVGSLGYIGVGLLVAIENIFPPIPSEVVLGLAGYTAARGDATMAGMLVAATIGSMVGAWTLYGFAAAVGPLRLRAIVIRYGSWIGFGEADLDRAEQWFDRWSRYAVLLCRCVPLIRSLISIPAGFRRMPLGVFTLLTLLGSLTWNTVLIGAGYLLGEQWERILDFIGPAQDLVVALMGLLVVAVIVRKVVLIRRQRAAGEIARPGSTHDTLEQVVADLSHDARLEPTWRPKPDEG
jgi:membrane protein DedA with SNARE-associated domain